LRILIFLLNILFLKKCMIKNHEWTSTWYHIIVLKLDPSRWVNPEPHRFGAGIGSSWRKNRGKKNSVDPETRLTRQDTFKNLIATCWFLFFFFTKTTSFWFFLRIDPDDPVTRSKPETWILDWPIIRRGLKLCLRWLNELIKFFIKKKNT
jgi:hypothetical protein